MLLVSVKGTSFLRFSLIFNGKHFVFILLFLALILATPSQGKDTSGPVFEHEPSDRVDFSSLSGTLVHCSSHGTPRPSIKWLQADGNLIVTSDKLRRLVNNGSLLFLPFQSEDYRPDVHSTMYRCVASNSVGTIVSREIHIKAVVPHPPDIQVHNAYSIVGSTAVLRCHVPAILSDYVHVTSWIRDGKMWIDTTTSESSSGKYQVMADGGLHILNIDMTDSGLRYQCKAANKLTGEVYLSATAGKVFVNVPQENVLPTIVDTKDVLVVKEGDTIIIPCATQGYPLPVSKWYKNVGNNQLHPLLPVDRLQKMGSGLRIRNVQFSDSGVYVCEASNDIGKKQVETVLTVTGKLHAEIKPRMHVVDLGVSVMIKCSITGHPVTSIRWVHNGKWLSLNETDIKRTTVLNIADVKLSDRGMYQCFVGNGFQSAQATTELRLQDVEPRFIETFEEKVLSPGQTISLKCIAFGLPQPQVTWNLDYMSLRKGNSSQIEERVDVNGNTVSVLHIKSVNVKDAGLYQCIVNNKAGKLLHSARINVHGPPFGRQIPKQIYVAGSTIFIHCPVYGHPIQVYQWEKEGRLLPINIRQAVYPNGTLVIEKVKKTEDAGKYSCSAWNKNGQRAQVTILVEVSVPPKITPFSFQDQVIREGMRSRLQCVVSDGDLPIHLVWWKDGLSIKSDQDVSIRELDDFSSILTINEINPRNNGNYTCVATNSAGSAFHTAHLFVNVAPHWLIEPKDTSVPLGNDVVLHCQADGSPQPSITWMKAEGIQPGNRKEVITTNMRQFLYSNGSLLVTSAEASDEGFYVCQATNGIDEGLSIVMHLYVNVPPEVKSAVQVLVAKVYQNLTIVCEISGDEPVDVSWTRNSLPIPVTRNSRYRVQTFTTGKGRASELIIQSIHREDSSTFTCSAKNAFGEDNTNITVTVQEPPDQVKKIKVSNQSSRGADITWTEPFLGNSPLLGYVIEYRPKDLEAGRLLDVVNVSISPKELSYTFADLIPATKYEVRLYAYNELGRSNYSQVVEVLTLEEAPSAPPQDIRVVAVDMHTVKVTWKPPKREAHNGKLRGYRVGYKIQSLNDPLVYKTIDILNNSNKEFSVKISNLKKFTIYEFVVEAYNGPGIGPASEPVLATTAEDVPSVPPVGIRCTSPTAKQITLTWQSPPPLSVNGILQGYKIVYKPVEEIHAENSSQRNITTKESKYMIESLRKFTNYSFQVSAYTKAGNGAISEPIFCRTLEDFPDPPAAIVAVPASDSSVTVSWKSPAFANGILKQYDVYVRKVYSPTKVIEKYTISASDSFYEVKNLSRDNRYEFWVTASTSVGEGKPTKVITQYPDGPLVPARIVTFGEKVVSMWNTNISLPCRAVGNPIPDLRWYYSDKPIKGSERHQINVDGSLAVNVVRGDDAGTYSCHVKNEFGKDEIMFEILVLEPPHPPNITIVTTTLDSIEIKFVPGKNGGLSLQEYVLQYKADDKIHWEKVNISKTADKFKIKNLRCGTKYLIAMAGVNKLGIGPMSSHLHSSTDGAVPSKPEKEKLIEEASTSITVYLSTWISNGCPIQNYMLEYKLKNSNSWQIVSESIKAEEKLMVIPNLESATWYTLRMTAFNSAGPSISVNDFATLTLTGGTIAPEFASDEGFMETKGLLSDWDQWIIVATASAVTVLLSVLVVTCLCVKHKKRQQRNERGAFQAGDKHNLRMREAKEIDFAYLRGNPDKSNFGRIHSRNEKKNNFTPYATPHLANHEMTLFTSHTLLPPEVESNNEGSGKEDSQTLPRFAKPKPYQSGFRTPTHDFCNRGMRTPHPVPIPTAPPIVNITATARGPVNGKPSNVRCNNSSVVRKKDPNVVGPFRSKKNNGKSGETTFVFPPPFEEQMELSSSATLNPIENIYENVPSGRPSCPTNIPSRPKLTFGLNAGLLKLK